MTDETIDQSVDTEVEEAPETQVEGEEQEVQLDDDGNPIEDDADLDEWTDDKGRVHKVPKALKEGELRQADYTRKTQEISETKKALETQQAEIAARQTFVETHAAEVAKFGALDHQAREWSQWIADNPDEATPADYHKLQTLKEAAGAQYQTLGRLQQTAAAEAQRSDAKAQEAMRSALQDPKTGIPGYSPKLEEDLATFAVASGYDRAEVAAIRDPRAVKMLHLAYLGQKATAKQSAAKTVERQQATVPAPVVGSGRAPNVGLSDKLPIDDWVKRRNQEIAKRGRR